MPAVAVVPRIVHHNTVVLYAPPALRLPPSSPSNQRQATVAPASIVRYSTVNDFSRIFRSGARARPLERDANYCQMNSDEFNCSLLGVIMGRQTVPKCRVVLIGNNTLICQGQFFQTSIWKTCGKQLLRFCAHFVTTYTRLKYLC